MINWLLWMFGPLGLALIVLMIANYGLYTLMRTYW